MAKTVVKGNRKYIRQGGIAAQKQFTKELWYEWLNNGTPTYAEPYQYRKRKELKHEL